jgi:4-hydroxybenzoate polyprenyltransferase
MRPDDEAGRPMTGPLAGPWAAVRLVHPAPTAAVTALSGALGAILLVQAGHGLDSSWGWTVAAVAGSQIFVGATNDLIDRARDEAAGRLSKPLAAGDLSPGAALWIASGGLGLQLAASLQIGSAALGFGLLAVVSALVYNIWLSRTPWSVVPYLVSFGVLPLWVASGVGVPLERVAVAPLLVAPFAAAAHLANVLRDFDADAALGSRNLAQVLGRPTAHRLAWGLAMAVGLGVGAALVIGGSATAIAIMPGVVGLGAVAQGWREPDRLWLGMLVAAVAWTAAWALATG